ncbi:MAG: ABC transporter permease [Alphaproteobacteria bacterium]
MSAATGGAERRRLAGIAWAAAARRAGQLIVRIGAPAVSILGLWYLAIWLSGLPEFVIPRPERVLATLFEDHEFISVHLLATLKAALLGFLLANVLGIGLAFLFVAFPAGRLLVMPAAITIRNIPYVALVSVLLLAIGDGMETKVLVVGIAGFFPVLVNTWRGLLSADPIVLDRMRILDAGWWSVFTRVRLPYSLPYIVAAQEITGSGSIIVTVVVEWMASSTGLGYVLNRALVQYRGDQVYAVALLAALLSFLIYTLVHRLGQRLNWRDEAA